MEKLNIKFLLPLLIGLFIFIGGLTVINTQEAEARRASYCNFIDAALDCWPGGINNCICIDVTPPTPPDGPVIEDGG